MELFFAGLVNGNYAELEGMEAVHCVKVLRHRAGDKITFTDGNGIFYSGIISNSAKEKCSIEILQSWPEKKNNHGAIHIAVAPVKNNERMDWFCEKAVEVGVNQISFIKCEHGERSKINYERIRRIAISAMKQSNRATLPAINEMMPFKEWINLNKNVQQQKFLCHYSENQPMLNASFKMDSDVCVAIGPEGDFSDSELMLAKEAGYNLVNLGHHRLRTETAAIVSLVQLNLSFS